MSAEADSLARIAEALERIAPAPLQAPDFSAADAFVWHVSPDRLEPVPKVNRVTLGEFEITALMAGTATGLLGAG